MVIREYNTGDLSEIYRLFYETVHSVNLKDYTRAQADAWAPFDYDREKWNNSLIENYCVVASENNTITGFGDIDESGYLDRLYVHRVFKIGELRPQYAMNWKAIRKAILYGFMLR